MKLKGKWEYKLYLVTYSVILHNKVLIRPGREDLSSLHEEDKSSLLKHGCIISTYQGNFRVQGEDLRDLDYIGIDKDAKDYLKYVENEDKIETLRYELLKAIENTFTTEELGSKGYEKFKQEMSEVVERVVLLVYGKIAADKE